jgi:hypothetical protein
VRNPAKEMKVRLGWMIATMETPGGVSSAAGDSWMTNAVMNDWKMPVTKTEMKVQRDYGVRLDYRMLVQTVHED